ncbi:MAG: ABC transporter ATP-binding protein, partial [Corynebacterium sp.]|nr:ABC transporter ATP-binding protein [Corynebacterium sp.]
IHESTITTGEILSIQALCVLMMGFAPSFQGLISGLSEVSAVAEKNEDLFSRPAASHLVEKTGGPAVMEVHDLNIHRGGKNLFRFPISTSIYRGDRIALIGESGIGKSSIIEALVGLSPCEGYVAVDSSIPRETIGIELPGMSLGEGSIREFVRDLNSGNEVISDESIWEVLDIVGISEVIRNLPEGLDSKILVDGGNLSTGQGQRLRLALSLLRNPSIVFWDEGLSHLDSTSSLALLRNLNQHEKFKDLTLVAVTHDLRVCQEMDRVWNITSSGLHEIRF